MWSGQGWVGAAASTWPQLSLLYMLAAMDLLVLFARLAQRWCV
jgi:hypothetical protein